MAVAALLAAAAASSYPVVAHENGVPVRAPAVRGAWGACPAGAHRLGAAGLAKARRAALLALPDVARQVRPALRLGGARVLLVRHPHRDGDVLPSRRACWGAPFLRSALVRIFLPAERGAPALRGNFTLLVARTSTGWIVWEDA